MSDPAANPPPTGHAEIDAALTLLDARVPVAEQAEQIQAVHAVLQQVLNPAPDAPAS